MLLHMPYPELPRRTILFKDYEVDLYNSELRRCGVIVPLQQQPFRILAILLEHPGDLVTRQDLQQRLWPDGLHVDFEHSLNRSVNKLRQALQDSAEAPQLIQTLPGRGYRFIGALLGEPQDRVLPAGEAARVLQMLVPAARNDSVPAANVVFRGALPLDSPYYIARAADVRVGASNRTCGQRGANQRSASDWKDLTGCAGAARGSPDKGQDPSH